MASNTFEVLLRIGEYASSFFISTPTTRMTSKSGAISAAAEVFASVPIVDVSSDFRSIERIAMALLGQNYRHHKNMYEKPRFKCCLAHFLHKRAETVED